MDFLHHEDLDTKEIHEMEMYFFEENRQKSRHLWILLFSMLPVRNIQIANIIYFYFVRRWNLNQFKDLLHQRRYEKAKNFGNCI